MNQISVFGEVNLRRQTSQFIPAIFFRHIRNLKTEHKMNTGVMTGSIKRDSILNDSREFFVSNLFNGHSLNPVGNHGLSAFRYLPI